MKAAWALGVLLVVAATWGAEVVDENAPVDLGSGGLSKDEDGMKRGFGGFGGGLSTMGSFSMNGGGGWEEEESRTGRRLLGATHKPVTNFKCEANLDAQITSRSGKAEEEVRVLDEFESTDEVTWVRRSRVLLSKEQQAASTKESLQDVAQSGYLCDKACERKNKAKEKSNKAKEKSNKAKNKAKERSNKAKNKAKETCNKKAIANNKLAKKKGLLGLKYKPAFKNPCHKGNGACEGKTVFDNGNCRLLNDEKSCKAKKTCGGVLRCKWLSQCKKSGNRDRQCTYSNSCTWKGAPQMKNKGTFGCWALPKCDTAKLEYCVKGVGCVGAVYEPAGKPHIDKAFQVVSLNGQKPFKTALGHVGVGSFPNTSPLMFSNTEKKCSVKMGFRRFTSEMPSRIHPKIPADKNPFKMKMTAHVLEASICNLDTKKCAFRRIMVACYTWALGMGHHHCTSKERFSIMQ
jgi:hypothetical protein